METEKQQPEELVVRVDGDELMGQISRLADSVIELIAVVAEMQLRLDALEQRLKPRRKGFQHL